MQIFTIFFLLSLISGGLFFIKRSLDVESTEAVPVRVKRDDY
jgi:hypothetical protein